MHALDLVNTVATAGVVLFARRLVGFMLGTTVNAWPT
jgi:hypothetical protein